MPARSELAVEEAAEPGRAEPALDPAGAPVRGALLLVVEDGADDLPLRERPGGQVDEGRDQQQRAPRCSSRTVSPTT